MPPDNGWRVYVIRCADNTFYIGASSDVDRRFEAHQSGRGARYTRGRGPLALWWVSEPLSKRDALRVEYRMKRLSHQAKEALRHR